jgi:O-antigen/teichoic acid export membrane protein
MAFVSQGGQAASSFLLTIVVARAVDPSIRGQFVLLTLIPQIGAYIATVGLPGAIMRSVAAEEGQRRTLFGLATVASCASGLVLTALTPLVMDVANSPYPSILLIFGETTALVWLIFMSWFAFGCERFMAAGVLRTVPILGSAIAILTLDKLGHKGLTVMFAPWAALHMLTAGVGAAYFLENYGFGLPSVAQTLGCMHYGIRYSTIQLLNLVTLRFDQLILGWLGTTAAVG